MNVKEFQINVASVVSNITNELQDLVPFGTLYFYNIPALSFQGVEAPDEWKWFDPPPFSTSFVINNCVYTFNKIIDDLIYLSIRGHLKITFKTFKLQVGKLNELCMILRLYLVPFDIHGSTHLTEWRKRVSFKKSSQWNERKYKSIIQNLITVLDFSADAWMFKYSTTTPLVKANGILFFPFTRAYEHFRTDMIGSSNYVIDIGKEAIKYHLERLIKNRKADLSRPTRLESDENSAKLVNIYNSIASPKLSDAYLKVRREIDDERYNAILDVINNDIPGMKSELYPYQVNSVTKMLEKELFPTRTLTPNMIQVKSPSRQKLYYIDILSFHAYKDPEYFLMPRAGILAENMGLGKTCICIALICASLTQMSEIPQDLAVDEWKDDKVLSLVEYCTREIQRSSFSWKSYSDYLPQSTINILENTPGFFYLSTEENINIRKSVRLDSVREKIVKKYFLCNTTLIVCPDNIFDQWMKEISKHTFRNFLKVLPLKDSRAALPNATEIVKYDVVLMSVSSFSKNAQEAESGLKKIYWKRFIIDEGHSMNSKSTRSAYLAKELLVERRWAVTGTPTAGMTILHVNESNENTHDIEISDNPVHDESQKYVIKNQFNERDDLQKLGIVVSNFLRIEPFHSSPKLWNLNIARPFLEGTYGSDTQLKNFLNSLIIRHCLDDVSTDIKLPPLHHKAVFLKPSFHNKLSLNLFIAVLAANAVSSERKDVDYMFHPANRSQLRRLVSNLQRATFFWSGFTQNDVETLVTICETSLKKERDDGKLYYDESDRKLLEKSIDSAKAALSNEEWRTISFLHEMTYYITDLPSCYTRSLGVGVLSDNVSIFGAPQINAAQSFFYKNRFLKDGTTMALKLDVFAKPFWKKYWSDSEKRNTEKFKVQEGQTIDTETVEDAMNEPEIVKGFVLKQTKSPSSMSTKVKPSSKRKPNSERISEVTPLENFRREDGGLVATDIRIATYDDVISAKKAKILGAASSKLSYLASRLLEHQFSGIKSIVFFEFEDTAYYLTELLDLLGINYIMYATFIKPHQRAKNISKFTSMSEGVSLVMDLKLASHGLTIISATRVYFINPIWRRSVEAQAIKRAHRIGQTNDVYVETLILEETLEEEMYKMRSRDNVRQNSSSDGIEVKRSRSVIDDSGMQKFILKHKFLKWEEFQEPYSSFSAPAISTDLILGGTDKESYSLFNHEGILRSDNKREWDMFLFNSLNLDKLNESTIRKTDDESSILYDGNNSSIEKESAAKTNGKLKRKDRIKLATELRNRRPTKKVKFA